MGNLFIHVHLREPFPLLLTDEAARGYEVKGGVSA